MQIANRFSSPLLPWAAVVLVTLLALSIGISVFADHGGTTAMIYGWVKDEAGNPLQDAEVRYCYATAATPDFATCKDSSTHLMLAQSDGHWFMHSPNPGYYLFFAIDTASATISDTQPDVYYTGDPLQADAGIMTVTLGSNHTLAVSLSGNGTVTSSPEGITCGGSGSDCSQSYLEGTAVTLTATPASGSTFSGWDGHCADGLSATTCDLSMTSDISISATFSGSDNTSSQDGELSGFVRDANLIAQPDKKVRIAKLDSGGAVLETWDVLTASDGYYVKTDLLTEYDYKVYMPLRSDTTPSEHLVSLSETNPAIGDLDFTIPAETTETIETGSGSVSGIVTDSTTAADPLSGVNVKVLKLDSAGNIIAHWSVLTSSLGRYALDGLPLGYTYRVLLPHHSNADPADYRTFLSSSVPSAESLNFAVPVDANTTEGTDGTIFGYVYDIDGDPAPDVHLTVHPVGDSTAGQTVTTDTNGKYIATDLAWPKDYRINLHAVNGVDAPDQYRLLGYNSDGILIKTRRADFFVKTDIVDTTVEQPADGENGTLSGTFQLPDGSPAKNVAIEVFANNGVEYYRTAVDTATASFSMSLPPDIYFVGYKILDDAFSPLSPPEGEAVVGPGSTHDALLTIQRNPSTLTVTVKKSDGTLFSGAWVEVSRFSTTAETDDTTSDLSTLNQEHFGKQTGTAGTATFKVPSGTWYVRVHAPHDSTMANPKEAKVVLDTGATQALTLTFRSRDAALTGTVLNNATGLPIDAFVGAWSESGAFAHTRANADGRYEMPVLGGDIWHVGAMANVDGVLHVARPVDVPVDIGATVTQNLIVKRTDFAIPPPVRQQHDPGAVFEHRLENGTGFACAAGECFSDDEQIEVSITPDVEAPEQGGRRAIGMAYAIEARGTVSGQDLTSLTNPASVTVPYTDADLAEAGVIESDLVISYYDEAAGTWLELTDCAVDSAANSVTCTTDHLTRFALLTPAYTTVVGATINEGDLIRGPDGVKVWIVNEHGYKRHIFNPAVFNMYGHFIWNNIVEVSQTTLDSYVTSDLYRAVGDTQVFSLEEIDEAAGIANKRWLNFSAAEFANRGYVPEQIFDINPVERDFYQEGSPIL